MVPYLVIVKKILNKSIWTSSMVFTVTFEQCGSGSALKKQLEPDPH